MNEIKDNDLIELLKCSICANIFDVPKVMPCGASVCEKCITNSYDSIDCVLCAQKHEINHKGFSTNYSIDRLLKSIDRKSNQVKLIMDNNETNSSHIYDNVIIKSESPNLTLFKEVNSKRIDPNQNYTEAKAAIEKECSKIESKINRSVSLLINDINKLKEKLLCEVQLVKNELTLNLNEHFENENRSLIKLKKEIDQLKSSKNSITENEEKLELLERKIDKLICNRKPIKDVLDFKKNPSEHNVTLIGEVNYSNYKYDLMSKIKHLNNAEIQIEADLTPLLQQEHLTKKAFGIFAKNKILLLYEKCFGRVLSLFMNVIYLDGTVIASNELIGVGMFHKHFVHDKYLLVLFWLRKDTYAMHLFDDKLQQLKTLTFNHELLDVHMTNNEIYLITNSHRHLVYQYDYELMLKNSFGQNLHSKKPFFICGEVFAVEHEKIFIKAEREVCVLSQLSGEVVGRVGFGVKLGRLIKDLNEPSRFVSFDNGNKVTLLNTDGQLLIESFLNSKFLFDECQLTKSGHFCFVNLSNNFILII